MANTLAKMIREARFVFICGNGGSAATAEHFTNDLFSKGVKAFCLNSNVSIMTMIANDFGYEDVFSRQLANYATAFDLLITISASGISPNILKAQGVANAIGMKTFAFKSFRGSKRNYEIVENGHLSFAHEIKKLL